MSAQLDGELVRMLVRLTPEKRRQVLDYACWLRENEHDSPPADALPFAQHNEGRGSEPALIPTIASLEGRQLECVEEYVRALAEDPPRGVPGHALLRFAGAIPEAALQRMERIIAEECERIDEGAW